MSRPTRPATWRCLHTPDDVLLAWEGEQHAVFFSPETGDTHLIALLGVQLAEWTAHAPRGHDELLTLLATQVDWDQPPEPDALRELLDRHLDRLTDIRLLTRETAA